MEDKFRPGDLVRYVDHIDGVMIEGVITSRHDSPKESYNYRVTKTSGECCFKVGAEGWDWATTLVLVRRNAIDPEETV